MSCCLHTRLKSREVNFLDLVDYWAVPLNRTFSVPIIQARDVTKIALVFFLTARTKSWPRPLLSQKPESY